MIKSRLLFFSALVLLLLTTINDVKSQNDSIVNRLKRESINRQISISKIDGYFSKYSNDGSFTDIDYASTAHTAWPVLEHLNRLYDICTAYQQVGNKFYHSTEILSRISKLFEFYYIKNPRSTNWWYEAIGVPIAIGPIILMMKSQNEYGLPNADLVSYSSRFLKYYSESIAKWPGASSGANKVWLLKGSIYKSAIEDNNSNLQSGFQMAFSELRITNAKSDGIKQDHSFYQHGPQLYCAGYGLNFLSDITYFAAIASGTSYQPTAAQLKLLSDVVIEGFVYFTKNASFDFGSSGREISREGALSTATLLNVIEQLISFNAPRVADLRKCSDYLSSRTQFPKLGNKYFWKMDMMVQHGTDLYMSVKAPSNRTVGTEWMNGENLKAKYLSWGATNFMKDGTEYRGVFPMWNWTMIPGVTSLREELQNYPATSGSNLTPIADFSGGVSDTNMGFISFEYLGFKDKNGTYDNLTAKKSYFLTPDGMYCFGSDISSIANSNAITTLNQCFSKSSVYLSFDSGYDLFTLSEKRYDNLKWVYHNGFGYHFPTNQSVTVSNKQQSGTWKDINTSGSSTTRSNNIFCMYINHGLRPANAKYNYVVVPQASHINASQWVNPFHLIANDSKKHCAYYSKNNTYAISFFSADSLNLGNDMWIKAKQPSIIMLQFLAAESKVKLSVADPKHSSLEMSFELSFPIEGNGVELQSNNTSVIKFVMPTGENRGSVASKEFIDKRTTDVLKKKDISKSKIFQRNNSLVVEGVFNENTSLNIYSSNGNLIYKQILNSNSTIIPIEKIGYKGVCLFQLSNSQMIENQKYTAY